MLNRRVLRTIHHSALIVGEQLLQHADFVRIGLALGGKLVELSILALESIFDDFSLRREQLVRMLKLFDQLLHFFFFELQAAYLLGKRIQI